MFGPEYFTVAGYLVDGGILCRECGDKAGLPCSDQIMQSEFNSGWEDGCYCDECGEEIVAPYEWTCPECDTVYSGEDALTAERQHYERGWCGAEKCCDLNAGYSPLVGLLSCWRSLRWRCGTRPHGAAKIILPDPLTNGKNRVRI